MLDNRGLCQGRGLVLSMCFRSKDKSFIRNGGPFSFFLSRLDSNLKCSSCLLLSEVLQVLNLSLFYIHHLCTGVEARLLLQGLLVRLDFQRELKRLMRLVGHACPSPVSYKSLGFYLAAFRHSGRILQRSSLFCPAGIQSAKAAIGALYGSYSGAQPS